MNTKRYRAMKTALELHLEAKTYPRWLGFFFPQRAEYLYLANKIAKQYSEEQCINS